MRTSTTTSRREHLIERLAHITDVVGLSDLTTSELESLAELLRPAHARVISVHTASVLRLVRLEDAADEIDGRTR